MKNINFCNIPNYSISQENILSTFWLYLSISNICYFTYYCVLGEHLVHNLNLYRCILYTIDTAIKYYFILCASSSICLAKVQQQFKNNRLSQNSYLVLRYKKYISYR